MTMTALTRDSIAARVADLRAQLPKLIADYPDDADFWPAYAELADEIKADAGKIDDDTWHWAFDLMQAALYENGKISAAELDV